MNIHLSLSGAGRGEGGGVAKQGPESDKAAAPEAFTGLFAGLREAAVAAAQTHAATENAKADEPDAEPELPIWPALVQDGLPAAAAEATAQAAESAEGEESASEARLSIPTDLAADAQPEQLESLDVGQAAELVVQDELQGKPTGGLAASVAVPLAGAVPQPLRDSAQASGRAAPATMATAMQGESVSAGPATEPAAGRLDAQQATALPQGVARNGGHGSSDGPAPTSAGRADTAVDQNGAQVIRRTDAGSSQAASGVQLPDVASARAEAQVSQLGPVARLDDSGRLADRPAARPDGGRPASGLDALSLNTSPLSGSSGARGADGMPTASGAQQAPVPAGQLAQHVAGVIRQMGGGRSTARIELHPAELGHLDLELRQDGQKLELSVTVDNEQTRRLIQDQLAQWRERLADAGMNLRSLDVEVRDQHASGRQDSDGAAEHATDSDELAANNSSPLRIQHSDRALDLYA